MSDIVQYHDEGLVDNSNENNDYDWIEGLDTNELEYMNNNDFDDVEDVNVHWDKNHDFSIC